MGGFKTEQWFLVGPYTSEGEIAAIYPSCEQAEDHLIAAWDNGRYCVWMREVKMEILNNVVPLISQDLIDEFSVVTACPHGHDGEWVVPGENR